MTCWSQGCFQGVDQYAVIADMEDLPRFPDQHRRLMEIGGIHAPKPRERTRRIVRRYRWTDAQGGEAWHLGWEPGEPKFTWAQDEAGHRSGRGECQPTLFGLAAVKQAVAVILCEGERDVETVNDRLRELSVYGVTVATCTPNGSGDVKSEYVRELHGKSAVYLGGDNDEAGDRYRRT